VSLERLKKLADGRPDCLKLVADFPDGQQLLKVADKLGMEGSCRSRGTTSIGPVIAQGG
jgi:hypothetical protein